MTKNNRIIFSIVLVLVVAAVIVGMVITGKNIAKAPTVSTVSVATTTPAHATSTASSSSVTVAVKTIKNYIGPSFSFSYPSSWSFFSISPFFMNNFNNRYQNGGIIPAGGAELAIVTTTISGSPNEIMSTELMNATQVSTAAILIDGVPCIKATYQSRYAGTMASQDIAIYCQRGNELWKIYLSYPAGDSHEKMSVADFNGMVASMKLTQ